MPFDSGFTGAIAGDNLGYWIGLFGRFVAVLRALAAVLAGINRMDWRRFLLFNAIGAIAWASVFGTRSRAQV